MDKKDLRLAFVIGAGVGILVQPIATNVVHGSPLLTRLLGSAVPSPNLRVMLFVLFFFLAPAALWIAYLLGKLIPVLYQFAKFSAVGVLNTVINVGVLNLLSLLTGITAGNLIPVFAVTAFLASTTNSYYWNKFWTFKSDTGSHAREAAKFYLIATIGALLNVGTISFVVNFLRPTSVSAELWLNAGALCGVAVSFLWDFFGYKFIVFKKVEIITPRA
ncbi:MAG: GtrA family protein [Candidatus Liptonbacteria bacterium]|nr:GtrA family protein [Candidatus Liptonbacteria bacterium]